MEKKYFVALKNVKCVPSNCQRSIAFYCCFYFMFDNDKCESLFNFCYSRCSLALSHFDLFLLDFFYFGRIDKQVIQCV